MTHDNSRKGQWFGPWPFPSFKPKKEDHARGGEETREQKKPKKPVNQRNRKDPLE